MKKLILLVMILAGASATSNAADHLKVFYEKKQQSTSKKAFERAANRIVNASPGMTQREFFGVMKMEGLYRNGKLQDVCVDGYLRKCSKESKKIPGTRNLVFGYIEGDVEVPRILVTFENNLVSGIEHTDPVKLALNE